MPSTPMIGRITNGGLVITSRPLSVAGAGVGLGDPVGVGVGEGEGDTSGEGDALGDAVAA